MTFELLDSASSVLWDYGWFDRSTFRVTDQPSGNSIESILADLVSSKIFGRSFCESPDPWGEPIDRHGPLILSKLSPTAYARLSHAGLKEEVRSILADQRFTSAPSVAQQQPVLTWLDEIQDNASLVLRRDPNSEVAWNFVWYVFHEFISFNPHDGRITVAVIGLD